MEYEDGLYSINQVHNSLDNDFHCEKSLCDYIELNMALFCEDTLGIKLGSYKREYALNQCRNYARGVRRLDFIITGYNGEVVVVECKNPTHAKSELSYAVGQVMSYICLLEQMEMRVDRYVIVSTKIDHIVPLLLNRFRLPIEFIAMDKTKQLTLLKNE